MTKPVSQMNNAELTAQREIHFQAKLAEYGSDRWPGPETAVDCQCGFCMERRAEMVKQGKPA